MFVIVHFIFRLIFLVDSNRIVIVSRVVITDCSSLVNNFIANMCYHALLCNHLYNVMSSFIL